MGKKKKPSPSPEYINNGLSGALGLGSGFGFEFNSNQGLPVMGFNNLGYGNQLSQVNTVFKNMRWYLISNMQQPLNEAYAEIGLVQNICNVPVDDALRGGIEIKTKQLDPEQINEINAYMEEMEDLVIAGQVGVWNRLFGGAGMIIMNDDDPSTPLDLKNIKQGSEIYFKAADMWELYFNYMPNEDFRAVSLGDNVEFFNYYGQQVHRSRVVGVRGIQAPSLIRPRLRGWGLSVVETLIRSINQYLKATDLSFEVLDEFKLDVYKIKNLVNQIITPEGTNNILKRVQIANMQKNYQNAITLDSEDDYQNKQLSFTGLADVMTGIRIQVASDMRMPLTKLFGVSSAGFNSGEDDIEVYNGMVEGTVRVKLKRVIIKMVKVRCQQVFGFIPDDLEIEFQPLRIMSGEQEENIKTQKFNRILAAKSSGEITPEEFRDACNKENLLGIHLPNSAIAQLDQDDVDAEAEGDGDEKAEKGGASSKSKLTAKDAKQAKNSLSLIETTKPYTTNERIDRVLGNSAEFDKKAYELSGGDSWIADERKPFFDDPKKFDEKLYMKSRAAGVKALGQDNWKFTVWMYQKLGGKM